MSISSSSDWPKAQNPAVAPASPFGAVHVCHLDKWELTQKKIRLKKYKKHTTQCFPTFRDLYKHDSHIFSS